VLGKGRVEIVRLKAIVEVDFMSVSEKRLAKVIWRALERHIKAGHILEVRRMPESDELEIDCCWCDGTVMA
jgi:hypothetical protein